MLKKLLPFAEVLGTLMADFPTLRLVEVPQGIYY